MSRNLLEKKTEHHLVPRNAIDIRGTNDPRNRVMLPEHIHTNWHRVFRNMEFHYQILRVLELNAPVVQKQVLREVSKIVSDDPSYVYQRGVYVPRVLPRNY